MRGRSFLGPKGVIVKRTPAFLLLCLAVISSGARAQGAPSPQPTTPAAQFKLGNEYLVQKDYPNAMTWFCKAADQGDVGGQNNVGWLYQNGWGVKPDYAAALTWYRKAADHGYATAQVNIGSLYERGLGVKQDYAEAMIWYRKASDQGSTGAQVNVGWLYQNGWGVKQD